MANVNLETDFARITVESKGKSNQEFLLEHALHMLMHEYRETYGPGRGRSGHRETKGVLRAVVKGV